MKKLHQRAIILIVAVISLIAMIIPATPIMATNPVVTITVTAGIADATNSQNSWAIGKATVGEIVYFSASGAQDDDYSMLTNTGNLALDVELQGTNFEGGSYDWTLASSSGDQQYSLYANKAGTPTVYDTEIKSSSYTDLTTNLAESANITWSMKFTAPSAFHASDNKAQKSASVTLVLSEHT